MRVFLLSAKLAKRGSITARSDKSDDKKDVSKPGKESTKTIKAEKSTTTVNQDKDKDGKQSKSRRMTRDQSSGEKKNDPSPPKTPSGRRASKADCRSKAVLHIVILKIN